MNIDLPSAVLAVGGLGTAAFGLVDATKAFGGGVSNRGFRHVSQVLERLFSHHGSEKDMSTAVTYGSVRATLRANWLNGTASLADQKSIAKTLIKLQLIPTTAAHLAAKTGVDPVILRSIAVKYADGSALTPEEQNVAGRFDLQLSTMIDEGYQRADQSYRNSAKVLAVAFAVVLALAGKVALGEASVTWGVALIAGLLAAPLAPVSKDLASALQASVKALQILRK
jgi:hypothetical protein